MLQKRWEIAQFDSSDVETLQKELKIHSKLCEILVQRGINTYQKAKSFFRPSLIDLHDPFLMKNMELAIERIEIAIKKNEKILVYGDYDVDGTTSVAIVISFFKKIHSAIDYYIPDRYKEGYGISLKGIDWAQENNCSLIIALDCGIKSIEHIEYANKKNIDFIICDHHTPGDILPEAIAILDPKQTDCNYPFKELSGCGIGFKLIQGYCQKNDISFESIYPFLDLVAISIASDIVPIVDENRILCYYGLKQINENPSPGIKMMMELLQLKKQLTVSDIVFLIGPRINAAGRMDDAKKAVKLLIAESYDDTISDKATLLNQKNTERRDYDKAITEEALAMINESENLQNRKTTVLYQPHWHKGVIGIVASRLIETYYRPTIILTESNGLISGSARSVSGFDLYEAIKSCSDLLEQFGGHKYAAGLTLKKDNLELFIEKFDRTVSETIDEKSLIPKISIDAVIELEDISDSFFNVIKQLAPFGPGNMNPTFTTKNVSDTGYSRIVKEEHLKISIRKNNSKPMNGIGFGMANYFSLINDNQFFDICYTLEENIWNGNKSIQLNMKDIK